MQPEYLRGGRGPANATREEAKWDRISYIEGYYNSKRLHSAIGWRVPRGIVDEFMVRMSEAMSEEMREAT